MKPGTKGWIGLTAVVIAADLLDERTMSEAFREMARHPAGRYVVGPFYVVLTAHLFGLIPPEYDPFHQLWKRVRKHRAE